MTTQKTILVVEDEKSIRDAIVDVLNAKKFNVIQAQDGREGVELALSEKPHLILLDLVMPGMDGMTALKKIRENDWGSKVPAIILTNLSANNEKLIEDMVTCKPINYLIKSDWRLHDILDKIEKLLKS
jgi:DNA-binding response OmpR family regulator